MEGGEALSRVDWRIPHREYGLGWWNINDPQHPDHKRLELVSPRDLQPAVPSNEEEEEEFHPTNPPRGIEVEESPVEETALQTKTPMPGGWKPVTELESNILTAQTQEVLDISTHDFGWSGENSALQPRMTAAAGREAIRSRPATPQLLIGSAAIGHTEGINPAFGNIGDLGAGIAQIGTATTQQLQPQRFGTGINPVFVGTRPYSTHASTTMGGGSSGGGGGGGSSGGRGRATGAAQGGGGNGSGMHENPPAVFTGDHSKSDKFLEDFKVYRMANQGNQTMRVPLERVALILTYIKGKNVQDWRTQMVNEIKCLTCGAPNHLAILPEDEVLWTIFKRDFRNAFTDSQKQLTTHQQFLKVKMQGNALNEFIVEFEHLCSEAGWTSNNIGTIMQFQHGLNTELLKAIVQHVCLCPRTLHKWFNAACEQHDIWNELKATIKDAKSTGPPVPLQRNTTYVRPSNAMDVDTVCVNTLTVKEKERLAKEGQCFKCKKQGHISCKCPEREENKNAPRRGNQGMTARVAAVEEKGNTQSRVEELAGGIRELADEEKDGLLDLLMEKGF